MASAYLTPTKPLNPSSVLTPSKSVGRLEPIALPWTPQWNQERAATPGLQKPEIMGDALTFLNKRTKRQQIMNNVKAFKDETTKFISEQKEAGTPVPILREAIVETVKGLSVHPDISVAKDDAVRVLDFGATSSPSRGQLPPLPEYSKRRGDAITMALEFLNARAKASVEKKELEKVEEMKAAIGTPLKAAQEKEVPDYLLEEGLLETLKETGLASSS